MTDMADCFFCRRHVEEALTVNVDLDGVGIVTCCEACWERGEEAADRGGVEVDAA